MRLLAAAAAALVLVTAACAGDGAPAATPTPERPTATTEPTSTPVPPTTTLLFTGDIIPARCVHARIQELGGDYGRSYDALRDTLTAADITVGTLDATAADVTVPYGCVETFSLAAPAAAAYAIAAAGFDVISHAANHVKDCGAVACGDQAMFETHLHLRRSGVAVTGAGENIAAAREPAIVERNGITFAFLAYDDVATWYHATESYAGTAPLDEATLADDIAAARRVADVVVVLPQWGIEYTTEPSPRQRQIAAVAQRAGADLVAGNHPHWVQRFERVDGMPVAYALGNFVFDQDWSAETQQGAMLEVTFTGTAITDVRFIPIRIHGQHQPRVAEGAEAEEILRRITG